MAHSVEVNTRKIDRLLFERRQSGAVGPEGLGEVVGHGCTIGRF